MVDLCRWHGVFAFQVAVSAAVLALRLAAYPRGRSHPLLGIPTGLLLALDPLLSCAPAAASVTAPTAPPGKPEKATTKAARPTTLLDVEEVEWITRELERLLAWEQSRSSEGVGDSGAAGRHRWKRARVSPTTAAAHKGGFLAVLLGRHAASICSGNTVDHSSAAARDRGRRRGGFCEVDKM